MILRGADNVSFTLEIVSYQFSAPADRDDANWLVIKGQLAGTARDWFFTEPCLLTFEAEQLLQWLKAVIQRNAMQAISFLEPELSFSILEYYASGVKLHLSVQSYDKVDRDWKQYPISLNLSDENLRCAMQEWESEITRFPVRS